MRIESRGVDELSADLARDVSSEVQRLTEANFPAIALRGVGRLIGDTREVVDLALNSAGDLADLAVNHLPGVTRSH